MKLDKKKCWYILEITQNYKIITTIYKGNESYRSFDWKVELY